MSAQVVWAPGERGRRRWGPLTRRVAVWGLVSIATSAASGYLIATDRWYVVPVALIAVPVFVLLHRYPMASIALWLLITPLVVLTSNPGIRGIYWLVHRALPLGTLIVIVVSSGLGIRVRKPPKLGWPEIMMGGYVAATVLSIALTSDEPIASGMLFYDRVVVPMCLYLILRLLEPDEWQLRKLVPVTIVLLLSQVAIGLVMLTAPGLLPPEWLRQEGLRTTGSLVDANTYGATLIFCAMVVLTAGFATRRTRRGRLLWFGLFLVAMLMVFLTFGRAPWVAGLVAVAAAMALFRGFGRLFVAIGIPLMIVALSSGVLASQLDFAKQRIDSPQAEGAAVSRLTAVVAAIRMVEMKPLTGWGYRNFDRYSRPFQRRVGDIVSAAKPRASHNTFLTLLAEQGVPGFLLFVGPMGVWAWRTRRVWQRMPRGGFTGSRFLGAMWLSVGAFVIVNNFSTMHVPFGLGLWWLSLGLVATLVDRYRQSSDTFDPEATTVPTAVPVRSGGPR